eukprot:6071824-Alexandrium_andersonii.AAC.1
MVRWLRRRVTRVELRLRASGRDPERERGITGPLAYSEAYAREDAFATAPRHQAIHMTFAHIGHVAAKVAAE